MKGVYQVLLLLALTACAVQPATVMADPTQAPAPTSAPIKAPESAPISCLILADQLNIRETPGGGVVWYTRAGRVEAVSEIVDGWGRLEDGAGWIYLATKYARCERVGE